jgi:hypothetical protein
MPCDLDDHAGDVDAYATRSARFHRARAYTGVAA